MNGHKKYPYENYRRKGKKKVRNKYIPCPNQHLHVYTHSTVTTYLKENNTNIK